MRMHAVLPNPLFRSEKQAALLSKLFFAKSEMSITDLSRDLGLSYPTVHREITLLLNFGILSEERVGNTSLLSPNKKSPFFLPLQQLIEVASGPSYLLEEALSEISGIQFAALFGSWVHRLKGEDGNTPRDIDLLVVGAPDVREINRACQTVGKRIGWQINSVILSEDEWREETPFLHQVKSGGLVPILGKLVQN